MKTIDVENYKRIKKVIPYFQQYRVKRGLFNSMVFDMVKLKANKRNIRLLKAALTEFGAKEIAVDGYHFYKFENYKK